MISMIHACTCIRGVPGNMHVGLRLLAKINMHKTWLVYLSLRPAAYAAPCKDAVTCLNRDRTGPLWQAAVQFWPDSDTVQYLQRGVISWHLWRCSSVPDQAHTLVRGSGSKPGPDMTTIERNIPKYQLRSVRQRCAVPEGPVTLAASNVSL